MATIETSKGKFSEMYVTTNRTKGVARLVADPYFYWLATSDASDNAKLDRLAEEAAARGAERPLLEAIAQAAQEMSAAAGGAQRNGGAAA